MLVDNLFGWLGAHTPSVVRVRSRRSSDLQTRDGSRSLSHTPGPCRHGSSPELSASQLNLTSRIPNQVVLRKPEYPKCRDAHPEENTSRPFVSLDTNFYTPQRDGYPNPESHLGHWQQGGPQSHSGRYSEHHAWRQDRHPAGGHDPRRPRANRQQFQWRRPGKQHGRRYRQVLLPQQR